MACHALLSCITFPYRTHVALGIYCVIQYNLRKRPFDQFCKHSRSEGKKLHCQSQRRKERFYSCQLSPDPAIIFTIQYNNKEGVPKDVWSDLCCVYPWILCGPASGGQAPLYVQRTSLHLRSCLPTRTEYCGSFVRWIRCGDQILP